jgi:putative tryptophan/tyrosine transport system substrate-binding protein
MRLADLLRQFRQGLSESGFVEDRNVAVDYRSAGDRYDRLPALAAELVSRRVNVIVANSTNAAVAAKTATSVTPIVFHVGFDPVELGLIASLNRPGGNITGVTTLNAEVEPKRLELLHAILPAATTIAVLINPTDANAESHVRSLQAAARILGGLQLHMLGASTEGEIDAAFAALGQLRPGGLVITGDDFFTDRMEQLGALARHHKVPAVFQYSKFVEAGGLMSYGGNPDEAFRVVGNYTGRVLKGEKPADLPIQQITKVQMIINLKTAKTLGLTIPETLLATADEVIE